jgi:hypothetical protein
LLLRHLKPDAQKVVLLLAYYIRAYTLPNPEFALIRQSVLENIRIDFENAFVDAFGEKACSYNFHVMSHLSRIRAVSQGPLTVRSATRFESYLAKVKATGVPNCANPAKLLMKQLLLQAAIQSHKCRPKVCHSTRRTSKQDDSILRSDGKWFRAEKYDSSRDSFLCTSIATEGAKWVAGDHGELNFSKVGVFRVIDFGDSPLYDVRVVDITGKGLIVGDYLFYAPENVLFEC